MDPLMDRFEQELNTFGDGLVKLYDAFTEHSGEHGNNWLLLQIVLQGDVSRWVTEKYNEPELNTPPLGSYLRKKSPGWFKMKYNEEYDLFDDEC